jgi:hypothetical protein
MNPNRLKQTFKTNRQYHSMTGVFFGGKIPQAASPCWIAGTDRRECRILGKADIRWNLNLVRNATSDILNG